MHIPPIRPRTLLRSTKIRTALALVAGLAVAALGLRSALVALSADYAVLISFQRPGAAAPAGLLVDTGEPFGERGEGRPSFGWVSGAAASEGAGDNAPAVWEIALPRGRYLVTLDVGAGSGAVRVEGVAAGGAAGQTTPLEVEVGDGRLTLELAAGSGPPLGLGIAAARPRPLVAQAAPAPGSTAVARDSAITLRMELPAELDSASLGPQSVSLVRERDGVPMPVTVSAGEGGLIVVKPRGYLNADTTYRLAVTPQLRDRNGVAAAPFSASFSTGRAGGPRPGPDGIGFDTERDLVRGRPDMLFSGVVIGPDGKLYVSTLSGEILRQTIEPDGRLGSPETIETITAAAGRRAIIGMAFDPASTARNPLLWVSHNGPDFKRGAADWSGRVSLLSGAGLEYMQDYVINLPHSFKDHMTNSLAFGTDGALYVLVGSNSAMGDPDRSWEWRPERLLNASVLRLDVDAVTNPPLDAKTEEGGRYDPYAPGAPLTLYATGVRNAYDLVWHSSGELYVPVNGSSAGGETPATPFGFAGTPACERRGYTGPAVPQVTNVPNQDDWLLRIDAGGYYGHPNPQRCEWVAYGGNPTAGTDVAEIAGYPVGTQPDPNWRQAAYNLGPNRSADGIIEYQSDRFGGRLRGWLIVAQYNAGNIVALKPGGEGRDIVQAMNEIPGLAELRKPLDLVEDPASGNLYIVEFGPPSMVTLLRPIEAEGGVAQSSTP